MTLKELYIDPNYFAEEEVSKHFDVFYKGKKIEGRIKNMTIMLTGSKEDFKLSELVEDYYKKSKLFVIKDLHKYTDK